MSAVRSEGRADELVRRADARFYRFPAGFAGFSARLVWETDAGRGEGEVEVRPGTEEPVRLHGRDESPKWVGRDLRSVVTHRSHRTYGAGDGSLGKELADDGPLGTRVELADELDSSYVIGEGQIALVSRAHESQRFTIAIQHRTDAGDGTHVPIRHQEGAMTAARAVADDEGAVIAALHDLNLAAAYADTVVLLFGGTLVAAGPPRRVLQPGLLTDVFGYPVVVAESPTGAPLVVPAR